MRPANVTVVMVALAFVLCGSTAGAAHDGRVRGRVLDETCPGPCAPGMNTHLYAGNADVSIRRLPGENRVATPAVREGRFHKRLDPGRYRLRARIGDVCWESEPITARVSPGKVKRVELVVRNTCVR